MPAWTPGPWKFDPGFGCKTIKGGKCGRHKQAQYSSIASTHGLANEDEDTANANLIAAAPCMYEALQDALKCFQASTDYEMSAAEAARFRCEMRKKARAALARAEGREGNE